MSLLESATESVLRRRVERLERCMLSLVAMASGEAQDKGTPDELEAMESQLEEDLTAMAREVCEE